MSTQEYQHLYQEAYQQARLARLSDADAQAVAKESADYEYGRRQAAARAQAEAANPPTRDTLSDYDVLLQREQAHWAYIQNPQRIAQEQAGNAHDQAEIDRLRRQMEPLQRQINEAAGRMAGRRSLR